MFLISMVTMNRKDILRRVLQGIEETCTEDYHILISDNGSTDGTPDMLKEMQSDKLTPYLLPENIGVARARNLHWGECVGYDAIKMDDKVLMLAPDWLTVFKVQSEVHHSLLGVLYDPAVLPYQRLAPVTDYLNHPGQHIAGEGGPVTYVPGELSTVLGSWDELPGCLYGWEEILYNHRARLMGWNYGFSLRVPYESLAQAGEGGRQHAMEHHADHLKWYQDYEEGERDVYYPPEETEGYKYAKERGVI